MPLNDKDKRFLSVFEIGHGMFGRELQDHFQNAQLTAANSGLNVTITAKIVIAPPERDQFNKGISLAACATHVESKTQKAKPRGWQLEIDSKTGIATASGSDAFDVLQEELKFNEDDNTAEFSQRSKVQ